MAGGTKGWFDDGEWAHEDIGDRQSIEVWEVRDRATYWSILDADGEPIIRHPFEKQGFIGFVPLGEGR